LVTGGGDDDDDGACSVILMVWHFSASICGGLAAGMAAKIAACDVLYSGGVMTGRGKLSLLRDVGWTGG